MGARRSFNHVFDLRHLIANYRFIPLDGFSLLSSTIIFTDVASARQCNFRSKSMAAKVTGSGDQGAQLATRNFRNSNPFMFFPSMEHLEGPPLQSARRTHYLLRIDAHKKKSQRRKKIPSKGTPVVYRHCCLKSHAKNLYYHQARDVIRSVNLHTIAATIKEFVKNL